jgi:hypothetical protein
MNRRRVDLRRTCPREQGMVKTGSSKPWDQETGTLCVRLFESSFPVALAYRAVASSSTLEKCCILVKWVLESSK